MTELARLLVPAEEVAVGFARVMTEAGREGRDLSEREQAEAFGVLLGMAAEKHGLALDDVPDLYRVALMATSAVGTVCGEMAAQAIAAAERPGAGVMH